MTVEERNILKIGGVDIDGALYRFGRNETVYISCFTDFLNDASMADYLRYAEADDWNNAFTAVHTLKGIAGNMGFNDLMRAAAKVVNLIREGRVSEAKENTAALNDSYNAIVCVIREYQAAIGQTQNT